MTVLLDDLQYIEVPFAEVGQVLMECDRNRPQAIIFRPQHWEEMVVKFGMMTVIAKFKAAGVAVYLADRDNAAYTAIDEEIRKKWPNVQVYRVI